MAKVTLADAFRAGVLDDPEFASAIREAGRLKGLNGSDSRAMGMLFSMFPTESERWPIDIDAHALAGLWFPNDSAPLPPEDREGTLKRAADLVRQRAWLAERAIAVVNRFFFGLRAGLVRASGIPTGSKVAADIPAEVWGRESTRVQVERGEVGRATSKSGSFMEEKVSVEWTAVKMEYVDTAPRPSIFKTTVSSAQGRPPEYSWDLAFNSVFVWIDRNGMPGTGAEFCELIEHALLKLDGKASDRDYTEAIVRKRAPDLWRFLTTGRASNFAQTPIELPPRRGGK